MLLIASYTADSIFIIYKYYIRLVVCSFIGIYAAIAHDDNVVVDLDAAGCGAVKANHSATTFTSDGVGLKAVPVFHIYNLYLLVF